MPTTDSLSMHHSFHRQRTRRGDQASEIEDQRDATVRHHGRAGNAGQPAQARAERLDDDLLAADDFAPDDAVALVADLRDDDVTRTPRPSRADPPIQLHEPQPSYTTPAIHPPLDAEHGSTSSRE